MTRLFAPLSAFHTREYGGKFAVSAALPDLALMAAPHPVPILPLPQDAFVGTAGDDNYAGGASDDVFDMTQGGNDTVMGRGGNDVVFMGDTMTAGDRIDGGKDVGGLVLQNRDWLYLDGDYSAGLVFDAQTVTRVENIYLAAGNSYKLTTHNDTVAAGQVMAIRGNTLGAADDIIVNTTAETDGTTLVYAGAGFDKFTGGPANEQYTFYAGALAVSDRINGGSGTNALQLIGDYSAGFVFGAKTMKNIRNLYPTYGDDYSLTMNDGNVAAGDTFIVWGTYLGIGDMLSFDGSAERDGKFILFGGPEHDTLIGGRQDDELYGDLGGDFLFPGKGADFVGYTSAAESGGQRYDFIDGFNFDATDRFVVDFEPNAIDATINSGSLSALSFDADLAAAVDAPHLTAGHAVVFKPSAGTLAGATFLIVDANGIGGYQSGGVDLVVRLTNAVHLSALDTADFI